MTLRLGIAVAICLCMAGGAAAQVVRFETTMGDFDMVLNPTHNTQLQGYVDNFLQYVDSERYLGSWIDRAAKNGDGSNFVLQMGGAFSNTKRPPLTAESTRPLATFNPVRGVPASTIGLSNTVGTVALALPSDSQRNPLRNAGTSSFFVNLGSNTFLDPDFTVFAMIPDLTVVNQIMALETIDRSTDLGQSEVPIQADDKMVFIKRAFVVSGAMTFAEATAGGQPLSALSANASSGGLTAPLTSGDLTVPADGEAAAGGLTVNNVPEPSSLIAALLGTFSLLCYALGRRR
jgi:cyclophilin family peptidyl-prolyl cis-trans isomerase